MKLAGSVSIFTSGRDVSKGTVRHTLRAKGAGLIEFDQPAGQHSLVPGLQSPIHPLQKFTSAIVATVAYERALAAHIAGSVVGAVEVGREGMARTIDSVEGKFLRIVEIRELGLELDHGVQPDGRISCTTGEKDLPVGQIFHGVNFTTAPGAHVRCWKSDKGNSIIHAVRELSHVGRIVADRLMTVTCILVPGTIEWSGREDAEAGLKNT